MTEVPRTESNCQFCDPPHPMSDPSGCPAIGVRAGGGDDAIHLIDAKDDERTLCDLNAGTRNAMLVDKSAGVSGWEGCWTCLMRRDERSEAA